MFTTTRVLFLCSALVVGSAGAAGAQALDGCHLAVEANPQFFSIPDYDPFAGGDPLGEFDVAFVNNGDAVCAGQIVAELNGETFGLQSERTGERLMYQLVDEMAARDLAPRQGVSRTLMRSSDIQVAPGARVIHRYRLMVSADQITADGSYSQTVRLSVMDGNLHTMGATDIPLHLNVRPSALIGLKGVFQRSNNGARIDLGELRAGAENLPLNIYVKSTRGYRVTVQSQNQGQLRLNEGGGWSVPYNLAIGERSINLGQGGHLDISSASFRNDDHPLQIVVGDVTGRRAGQYSDILTLSVAPL